MKQWLRSLLATGAAALVAAGCRTAARPAHPDGAASVHRHRARLLLKHRVRLAGQPVRLHRQVYVTGASSGAMMTNVMLAGYPAPHPNDGGQPACILVGVEDSCRRHVSAHLEIQAHDALEMVLQLAVAALPAPGGQESLTISCDGAPLTATEVVIPGEGRAHVLSVPPGRVLVDYQATVESRTVPPEATPAERLTYLRPSRYAECDELAAVARAEFAGISAEPDLLAAVSSWVGTQLSYVPGSSRPTDGAVRTLLQRQGVCRDYAHLVIALLRALDVPARLAAVYAPGLNPMDFHAVAEVLVDGYWRAVDATLLAPRASLVRIATGRDAADTAFLSTYGGAATLTAIKVTAVLDGRLPDDDITRLATIS